MTEPAYDDLDLPRTELAAQALRHARDLEDPAILNHSVRTYLYGRFAGRLQGLHPGRDYDDELFFLGSVLHDTGLTPEGDGDQQFNLDGADLAARFLAEQGLPDDRIEIVWDAIALHFHHDIAIRKRPEIALVSTGAGFDLGLAPPELLPPEYTDRVHAALPRLHIAAVLHDAIVGQALAKPQKGGPFSFAGELVRQKTGAAWPTWQQMASTSGRWDDYDGYQPAN
jgi:hypothetical protein